MWQLRDTAVIRRRVRVAEKNLSLAFPDWTLEKRRLVLEENLRQTGAFFMENLFLLLRSHKTFVANQEVHEVGDLDYIKGPGPNVLIVTLHCTSLDSCGSLLSTTLHAEHGPDVVYRKQKPDVLNYLLYRRRMAYTTSLIRQEATSEIIDVARDNDQRRYIWMAPDQDFGAKRSVFVPFLGVPAAATLTAPVRLASRYGLCVVFAEAQFVEETGKWSLTLHELKNFPTGDVEADAAKLNEEFSKAIRRNPEQYYWVHRRFKTLPSGELRDYS